MKKILLLLVIVFSINAVFAQSALKILKDDGSITYINASAVNTITFVTPLAIGDTHQGGKIFYLDASGEHGLIAAPSDQSTGVQWFNGSNTITNAVYEDVGSGEMNTNMIYGNQGFGDYAAYTCFFLSLNSYTDWFLPSSSELNLMYTQKALIGGFAVANYWSSTEWYDGTEAWGRDFDSGNPVRSAKSAVYYVRAIRAF